MAAGFPLELPIDFVFDDDPPGPFLELGPDDIARVESHCEDGQALLIDEFRRPRVEAMLCALLEHVQELDDASWRVLTERTIDNAIGVQLDALGSIIGQGRVGLGDEDYRAILRARTLVNRSDGGIEALYGIVVAALSNPTTAVARIRYYGTAAFTLRLLVPVAFDEGIVNTLIQAGKSAGVRAVVVVPMASLAGSFSFGPTSPTRTLNPPQGFADSVGATGGVFARAMDEGT